ncbi:hypothetical protein AB0284_21420 [Pseudarthrobacter phenanthrenivorans]|uniref:hypothetical protein n=1 Tax=Pseudarthrobacter phenanthrenivorans TaxID=361575 RepID=UPI00344D7E37
MNRDYYGGDDPYEAIKVIRAWGLNFALGSVLKYIKRHGNKPGEDAITCLTKARDYLDDEINALRAANTPDRPTTPEPETSPAKPGPSASQDGLRVGARVKIIHRPFSFTPHVGREALIKEEVVAGAWYQLALDGKGAKFMFRADELEVIE